jgi:endonuclease/exonuclease/phosphatase family metal-dependent hydrolase
MFGRSRRGLWRSVAGGCSLVSAIALAACEGASSDMTPRSDSGASMTFRVLQMNLCDSGIAGCYTGRSVAEAAAVIRAQRPDIVTLNEVCRDDVSVLEHTLSNAEHGSVVTRAFQAALDQRTGDPVRCHNGQQYGIGLLAGVRPPHRGFVTLGGRYPAQDPADTEKRVWLCVHAIAHFYACTTHLSSTSPAVAISECRYLMDTAIPTVRTQNQQDPLILGADLNLTDDQSPNAQSCMPPGFVRVDDGSTQDVVVSASRRVTSNKSINMHGTTDHPGLLADLATDRRHGRTQ